MIEELHIRGLGVIEDATLELGDGLTVVTGETGAGKTLLVTALELLLGARASTGLVRRGHRTAVVEAVLRAPEPTAAADRPDDDGDDEDDADAAATADAVRELWDLAEDGLLIVSREIPAEGRSRARVGGRLVPTSLLTALLGPHVEVHGQHEHVRLERPAVQRRLLDGFGDDAHRTALDAYRTAHLAWETARERLRRLTDDAGDRAARLDRLRAEADEIDAAALDVEADGALDRDIDRLANADALRDALDTAHTAAGPSGALDSLGRAVAALRRTPGDDTDVAGLADRLAALSSELSDAVADLATLAGDVEADDARLDALQQRKRDVTRLLRRYGASVEDVLTHRATVARELDELEALTSDAGGIEAEVDAAHQRLVAAGATLTAARRATGERLTTAVGQHLAELGLPHAHLTVDVRPAAAPTPDGLDRVELLLAANPGEPAARLADAASGGERSRVALALEVVLTAAHGRGVLVFDEVDAGIGGTTALAVGEKLARLAGPDGAARQVLCVTHLAQVAAAADDHHRVEKVVVDGRTVTRVERVADDERAAVISRMLGGDATADAGLEHARGLLAAARSGRPG